jgi:hypothetical protein
MQKRFVAVFAVAAAAGVLFPFGLPKSVDAVGPSYTSLSLAPLPIEQPGTLNPSGTNTVQMCAQPMNGTTKVPGATIFLSINAGLFTAPEANGGSATAEGTGLTVNPAPFVVQATCTFSNNETPPTTIDDAVPITYTGPNPVPINGRDQIVEADASSDVTITPATGTAAAFGTCTSGICNVGTYVFSPVTSYHFSATPIATTGSLTASDPVTFTVTALDGSSNAVPGAFIDLTLQSTAVAGGSATAVNILNGHTTTKTLNNQATNASRFGADSNGSVSITYTTPATLPTAGTDTVTAQNHPTATVTATTTYTYGSTVAFSQAPFAPVPHPFRLCDTRPVGGSIVLNQCNEPGQGPLGQGTVRTIQATGVSGSGVPPTGVTAVVVNVTAITPNRNTFITVYPAGASRPATSNLNPLTGTVIANLVEVGVNGSGQMDVFNDVGTTGLIVDVEGYVSSASTGLYNPLAAPVRICDTRAAGPGINPNQCNVGGTHPINGGASLSFAVHTSTDNVPPSNVSAVVFNLTAINPTVNTVLTAYPGLTSAPTASNLNLSANTVLPNRVVVPVGTDGTVDIKNSIGSVNVAVDIDGYFTTGTGSQFTALPTPARVCNTDGGTSNTGGCVNGVIGAGHVLNIFVTGIDGIPPTTGPHAPTALVINVTAVNATTGTFVTVYPGPLAAVRPTASDLNLQGGQTIPNLVFVGVGADGSINLYNNLGNVNLIVDVLGYYS